MSTDDTPAPSSLELHAIGNSSSVCTGESDRIELDGSTRSIVLTHWGVTIGALLSNTMDAVFRTEDCCGRLATPATEYTTDPWPSGELMLGGRNPAEASRVGSSVPGSIDSNFHSTSPVFKSREPATRRIRLCPG